MKSINVVGMPRTGTNYLEKLLLLNNYKLNLCENKHGFYFENINELSQRLTLVIYKNPILWVESILLRNDGGLFNIYGTSKPNSIGEIITKSFELFYNFYLEYFNASLVNNNIIFVNYHELFKNKFFIINYKKNLFKLNIQFINSVGQSLPFDENDLHDNLQLHTIFNTKILEIININEKLFFENKLGLTFNNLIFNHLTNRTLKFVSLNNFSNYGDSIYINKNIYDKLNNLSEKIKFNIKFNFILDRYFDNDSQLHYFEVETSLNSLIKLMSEIKEFNYSSFKDNIDNLSNFEISNYFYAMGSYEESIRYGLKCIQEKDATVWIYHHLSHLYYLIGDYNSSREYNNYCLELYPNNKDFLFIKNLLISI